MTLKHTLRITAAETLQSVLPHTSYALTEQEYLGTYDNSLPELRERLRDRGYHYQLFAATKQHPSRDQIDSGSYARIPERHPPTADGAGLAELNPRECQYHVQLFEVDGSVELYGHYEVHPYPWTPTWDINRPYPRHYYPTWDNPDNPRSEWTYLRGVVDDRIRVLLTNDG